jgi:hypothetical protein
MPISGVRAIAAMAAIIHNLRVIGIDPFIHIRYPISSPDDYYVCRHPTALPCEKQIAELLEYGVGYRRLKADEAASLSVCQVKTVSGRCMTAPTPSMRVYGAPLLVDGSPRRRIGSHQDAMVRPPHELPCNFGRHMSKKTPGRGCLVGIQLYIVGYSGTVDWQTKRPERRVSKPNTSSCLHGVCSCIRLCMLTATAMTSWLSPVDADTGRPLVVIVPPVRPPSPPERAVPAQPALQWAPPLAMGLTPGLRSPTARCYAGPNVCPLTQPEHIGESCTCGMEGRPLPGRALIPPSRDISSMILRTN